VNDAALVAAFESTELEPFSHVEHVRVAWWYLRTLPLADALARCSTGIRRFAAARGATEKYHETITVAFMLLITERVNAAPALSWDEFAAANRDLFSRSLLSHHYSEELLNSDRARRAFVMPDRHPLPHAAPQA
jgi:hypothetical protein